MKLSVLAATTEANEGANAEYSGKMHLFILFSLSSLVAFLTPQSQKSPFSYSQGLKVLTN